MLADKLVAGREIANDVGASKCQISARGIGCPYVFAYFDAELYAIGGNEDLALRCEYGLLTSVVDGCLVEMVGGCEPSFFVKLAVIGQIGFGNDAKDVASLKDYGAIEQDTVYCDRHANHGNGV